MTSLIATPTARLVRTEAKLFLREPLAVFWGVAFPVVLLVVMGLASDKPDRDLDGLRLVDAYVPILLAFTIAVVGINALPTALAGYRERGVLRRMATTPVAPVRVLGAQLAVYVAVIVAAGVLVLAVARIAFDVGLPGQAGGFLAAFVLSAAAMLGLGLLLAAVAPTMRTANALGAIAFFPMMFFAGLWVPRETMSATLRHVSDATPLGAGVAALQEAMQGQAPHLLHLAVLAAWAVAAGAAATRLFRWE